jgi:hypothetical protein
MDKHYLTPLFTPNPSSSLPGRRWCCPAASARRRPQPNCTKMARREGMYLLGPNSLGLSARICSSTPARPARWPRRAAGAGVAVGRADLVHLDWARRTAWAFRPWSRWAPTRGRHRRRCWTSWPTTASTHSIVVYMEGISNARRFMSALRAAANAKPVVVLKAGRKPAGNEALKPTAAPSSAATTCSTPPCAAPARCGCAPSSSCSRPPSAWPRATARWAGAWPSSPTAAAPACWRPTGSTRSGAATGPLSPSRSRRAGSRNCPSLRR